MDLSKIIQEVNQFNNSDIDSGKNEYKSTKEYRGNQHELDTYLNTIKYMEYKKNVRKNVRKPKTISEENTFSDYNALQSHLEETQYKKKWCRLDSYLKKKKIQEYIKNLIKDEKIKEYDYERYFALLNKKITDKQLNTKSEVTYDEDIGIIVTIPFLDKLISNL